jgi:hypothetical protein
VVKATWERLGLGREGGGQPGEEGNTELELRTAPSQPPVSRILVVGSVFPAISVVLLERSIRVTEEREGQTEIVRSSVGLMEGSKSITHAGRILPIRL